MSNELIFVVSVIFYLGCVVSFYKLWGKNGLYILAVFSTLLGNIAVCKCINLFGLSTTAGNVLYAATFLVTDILSEKYGKKAAQRAVYYSFATMVLWLIGTKLILSIEPNANDMVSDSMVNLFSFTPRILLASICGFVCSQNIDVFLYHLIWKKTGNNQKFLWLRNNGSTLTSQALDTVIFAFIAFYGVYPTNVFISILLTTYLFKAIVALSDTPFIYIARKIKPLED